MKAPTFTLSCEIGELLDCIVENTGKSWDEVETQAFKSGVYPEGRKTYVADDCQGFLMPDEKPCWLREEIRKIIEPLAIEGIYITEEI